MLYAFDEHHPDIVVLSLFNAIISSYYQDSLCFMYERNYICSWLTPLSSVIFMTAGYTP